MLNSMRRRLKLAATGDSIITRKLSVCTEPAFLRMVDLLRTADVRFTNLEITLREDEGHPAVEAGGTWLSAHPAMLDELKWLGFNMYAWANNHTFDWSEGGMLGTLRTLERGGVVHAGAGRNLAEARGPAYLDIDQGRVALVAMTSTFATFSMAGNSRPDCPGRPGVNPLRYESTVEVDNRAFGALQQVVTDLRLDARQRMSASMGYGTPPDPGSVTLGNLKFRPGERPGIHTVVHPGDAEGNLSAIREARRQADWVVVSIHSHEWVEDRREEPAEFLPAFARTCIDAGADIVIGHGPHVLRGLEIYKGKPIFYCLANFIFESETVRHQPADWYEKLGLGPEATLADLWDVKSAGGTRGFHTLDLFWESVIPLVTWEGGELAEIRLYPISLGFGLPRPARGRPVMADQKLGRKIIERLNQLSIPFGAQVKWHPDGYGVVPL